MKRDITERGVPTGMRIGRRELNTASLRIARPEGLGLQLDKTERMREVLEIHVPLMDRNRRLATALLNFVCQEADAHGMTLILTARQFGDTLGPDEDRLVLWYQKFGFTVLQQSPDGTIMARQVSPPPPKISPLGATLSRLLN